MSHLTGFPPLDGFFFDSDPGILISNILIVDKDPDRTPTDPVLHYAYYHVTKSDFDSICVEHKFTDNQKEVLLKYLKGKNKDTHALYIDKRVFMSSHPES